MSKRIELWKAPVIKEPHIETYKNAYLVKYIDDQGVGQEAFQAWAKLTINQGIQNYILMQTWQKRGEKAYERESGKRVARIYKQVLEDSLYRIAKEEASRMAKTYDCIKLVEKTEPPLQQSKKVILRR